MNTIQKIRASHLQRKAYLYIRQSTLFQTEHNTESTDRQYQFQNQAIDLGWHQDQLTVIDEDLGLSGADAVSRTGFQRLIADVTLGQVGIVLSLEASRLARNSSDWHRLLELCALTETLLLDEDGIYDPNQFNDRLLLGLRGTMSEAELHFLRARMEGGKLNKAKRGELRSMLPAGLIYQESRITIDPDRQVQDAIRCIFQTFQSTGSAWGTVRQLSELNLTLPVRRRSGPQAGTIQWVPPSLSRVLHVIKNPRYAGVYFYGRTRQKKGLTFKELPQDDWKVFIKDSHPGYISWEQYEQNLALLRANGLPARKSGTRLPPREGPALLQGIIVCGKCGRRMSLCYHHSKSKVRWSYYCQRNATEHGGKLCQQMPGVEIDQAVSELIVAAFTHNEVEVALAVHERIRQQHEQVASLHRSQIDRARYEAELAERQFLLANPENRLVVDTLEDRWNDALRALATAEQAFDQWRQDHDQPVSAQVRDEIVQLLEDFPRVWNHPHTSARDRKQILRLLIEDVTLLRQGEIQISIRWRGGALNQLQIPIPLNAYQARTTDSALLQRIRELAENYPDVEIAQQLQSEGKWRSGMGLPLTGRLVSRLRHAKKIPGYGEHLRARGMLTADEIAQQTGCSESNLHAWRKAGLVQAIRFDRKQWLFEFPSTELLQTAEKHRETSRLKGDSSRHLSHEV